MKHDTYLHNGLSFSKKTLAAGSKVEVYYNGLLKIHGAEQVNLHVGYGELWDDATYIPMVLIDDRFCTMLELKKAGLVQLAFVDNAGNWDNNTADNYRIRVTSARKTTKVAPEATGKTPEKKEKAAQTKKTVIEETLKPAKKVTKKVTKKTTTK